MARIKYYKASRATKQVHIKGVCLLTSIIKDQISIAMSLGIRCVSLLDITLMAFLQHTVINNRTCACVLIWRISKIFPRNLS